MKRLNFRSLPTHTAASTALIAWFFVPIFIGSRTIACSVDAIRPSIELRGRGEAEADVVVPILRSRKFGIAVRDAAILRVVVPRAAAKHTVRTLMAIDLVSSKVSFLSTLLHLRGRRKQAKAKHGAGICLQPTRQTDNMPQYGAFLK